MGAPRVLSLFTGAGGLDFGLEAAGFEIAVANDVDHDSCETVRRARRYPMVERSIIGLPAARLLVEGGLRAGDVDLVAGGPPCQPFSKAGFWSRGDTLRLADPRADTLE